MLGVDSWVFRYGVICGMLIFLLPFILPSVKQVFSLFLPRFLPGIPAEQCCSSARGGW